MQMQFTWRMNALMLCTDTISLSTGGEHGLTYSCESLVIPVIYPIEQRLVFSSRLIVITGLFCYRVYSFVAFPDFWACHNELLNLVYHVSLLLLFRCWEFLWRFTGEVIGVVYQRVHFRV